MSTLYVEYLIEKVIFKILGWTATPCFGYWLKNRQVAKLCLVYGLLCLFFLLLIIFTHGWLFSACSCQACRRDNGKPWGSDHVTFLKKVSYKSPLSLLQLHLTGLPMAAAEMVQAKLQSAMCSEEIVGMGVGQKNHEIWEATFRDIAGCGEISVPSMPVEEGWKQKDEDGLMSDGEQKFSCLVLSWLHYLCDSQMFSHLGSLRGSCGSQR